MCLIIETRKDILIPKFVMEDMYKRNDDGYGFMYVRNGHTFGEKYEGKSLEELYEKYLELREYEPYIHLRMKTHGDINADQSHPFYCGYGIWLMHNGILSDTQGEDLSKSDTWYFANEYLKPIFDQAKSPEALIATSGFQRLISKFIGQGNRIVLLDRKIGGLRFNDSQWHTINNEETQCVGMKVSNTYAWNLHSKPRPIVHQPNTTYYGRYGGKYQPSNVSENSQVIVPPGIDKSKSLPGDPAGSFRDKEGDLWVYNGRGWLKYNHYKNLYPNAPATPFNTFGGSEEVSQAHPTFPKIEERDSQKSGIVRESEKSNESWKNEQHSRRRNSASFIDAEVDEEDLYNLDAYQDWLCGSWGELSYHEICQRIKESPEEAADVIAFSLGVDIDLNYEHDEVQK